MAIPFKSDADFGDVQAASIISGPHLKVRRTTGDAPSSLPYGSLGIANNTLYFGDSYNKAIRIAAVVSINSITDNISFTISSGYYNRGFVTITVPETYRWLYWLDQCGSIMLKYVSSTFTRSDIDPLPNSTAVWSDSTKFTMPSRGLDNGGSFTGTITMSCTGSCYHLQ